MKKCGIFCTEQSAVYLLPTVHVLQPSATRLIASSRIGHIPVLLSNILSGMRGAEKVAFRVWGKNITFGALLKTLYATPIS